MNLTIEDYRPLISEAQMAVMTQQSDDIRLRAEKIAQAELASYLHARYDVHAIFEQQGEQRDTQLVTILATITLYHLSTAMPQKMASEVREKRYNDAIAWLRRVNSGEIPLQLPPPALRNEASSLRFSSDPPQNSIW